MASGVRQSIIGASNRRTRKEDARVFDRLGWSPGRSPVLKNQKTGLFSRTAPGGSTEDFAYSKNAVVAVTIGVSQAGKVHPVHKTYLRAAACLTLAVIFGVAATEFSHDNEDRNSSIVFILKAANTLCTVLGLGFFAQYYWRDYQYLRKRKLIGKKETFCSIGFGRSLLFELLICCIHSPPGLHGFFTVYNAATDVECEYSIDDLLVIASFVRLYVWYQAIHILSGFPSNRNARALAVQQGVALTPGFTFRYLLYRYPVRFILLSLISVVVVMGYALRIAERPANPDFNFMMSKYSLDNNTPGDLTLHQLTDSCWLIAITMTTVGYGGE